MSGLLPRCAAVLLAAAAVGRAAEPYETYVKTSRDFKPVRQEKAWALKAWPSWTYMPWTWKWRIGYDDDAGRWCRRHGYNGAFLDHGRTRVGGADKLAWINAHKLRFYMDHTAGKGELHLRHQSGERKKALKQRLGSPGLRLVPLNEATAEKLRKRIADYVGNVKRSPRRAAYALDDEVSWGSFVRPCTWRLIDDRAPYEAWLKEVYGADAAPDHPGWITYNDVWPKLRTWALKDFDCAQLMDQWTFNDAYWANYVGDLVACANEIDPATPCGFVGGQAPNAFGGYDYARLMRKIQFIEAYNLGGSQAVIRSFNPRNALPQVTTHFHRDAADTIWQTWYYLAHGNRGFIGWVNEGWFPDGRPAKWHDAVGPHYKEAAEKIGPLMTAAEWVHDGVAIYYSHPSIQMSWVLDAEAHKGTWANRNNDHRLGTSHLVRKAWENMLRDEGLQYDFVSYVDVIRAGVPDAYKVLILPACYCLSDVEADRIRAFCRRGGTVVADFLPGVFNQHGRGRKDGGVLDDLFGVRHAPTLRAKDVFATRLWAETDQEANYYYMKKGGYEQLLTNRTDCIKDRSGFHKAVRKGMPVGYVNEAARRPGEPGPASVGKGRAVLMNLSPQWYNAYRVEGYKAALKREVFMKHVKAAGVGRWVEVASAGEAEHGFEITYWAKDGRTILFLCFNPEVRGGQMGGGNAAGLKTDRLTARLKFRRRLDDARNERTGQVLGSRSDYSFQWTQNEAVVMSFKGNPPR